MCDLTFYKEQLDAIMETKDNRNEYRVTKYQDTHASAPFYIAHYLKPNGWFWRRVVLDAYDDWDGHYTIRSWVSQKDAEAACFRHARTQNLKKPAKVQYNLGKLP